MCCDWQKQQNFSQAHCASGLSHCEHSVITVAASWSNELWEVQLNNTEVAEPIRRQYDPTRARSAEGAANYFVDELRRATGQEPILRPETLLRHNGGRRQQRV